MSAKRSAFWDDLAEDLQNPDFRRDYVLQALRIATIDRLVNDLDEARRAADLPKSELARLVGIEPSTVRRLFSSHSVNPTLGTVTEIAAALGLQVIVVPMPPEDSTQITEALAASGDHNLKPLVEYLVALREQSANETEPQLT